MLPTDATNSEATWSVDPDEIATIDADGLLIAVANGTVTIRATAKDGSDVYGEIEITITGQLVAVAAVITTESLADGRVGRPYSQTLTATGTAPITWSLAVNSNLPTGLTLNSATGVISGTPTGIANTTPPEFRPNRPLTRETFYTKFIMCDVFAQHWSTNTMNCQVPPEL